MEYVVGVFLGLALLAVLFLLRRKSRPSMLRWHLSFHPHTDKAGNLICFAMGPSRSSANRSSPPQTPMCSAQNTCTESLFSQ
jgi:hypothetical protein